MAQENCGLKKVGTVSIDGTKIKANASKHSAANRSTGCAGRLGGSPPRPNTKKRKPRPPVPPPDNPPENRQYNFTDPESRIMKTGATNFEQAYNARAAVDTETMFIVGETLTDAPTDKQQLVPAVGSIPEEVAVPENIPTDTGYYEDGLIMEVESGTGVTVYCASDISFKAWMRFGALTPTDC